MPPLSPCGVPRGDFYGYMTDWGKKSLPKGSFLSISEAAAQMREWLREDNVSRLFIATNARKHELDIYKALLQGTTRFNLVSCTASY